MPVDPRFRPHGKRYGVRFQRRNANGRSEERLSVPDVNATHPLCAARRQIDEVRREIPSMFSVIDGEDTVQVGDQIVIIVERVE
jgi:hypothetical protein